MVFPWVVSSSDFRRGEENPQQFWIASCRPECAAVQATEHQQAGEEGVEQIERGRSQEQRQEELPPVDAPDREWSMQRLVDGPIRRAIGHHAPPPVNPTKFR